MAQTAEELRLKACERSRKYRKNNKTKVAASLSAWKNVNKSHVSEYNSKYKDDNSEAIAKNRQRNYILKRYGLTIDSYHKKYNDQKGLCALCGKPETLFDKRVNRPRTLSVDHDHETNVTRSLLCNKCNKGLGLFLDSPDVLRKAADYIDHHKASAIIN